MKKDKIIQDMESKITDGMSPLEHELLGFVELVQSSVGFFDMRFLKVVKRNKKAYFVYGRVVKEFPVEYLTQAD